MKQIYYWLHWKYKKKTVMLKCKVSNINPYKISNKADVLLVTLKIQKENSDAKMQSIKYKSANRCSLKEIQYWLHWIYWRQKAGTGQIRCSCVTRYVHLCFRNRAAASWVKSRRRRRWVTYLWFVCRHILTLCLRTDPAIPKPPWLNRLIYGRINLASQLHKIGL